MKTYCATTVYKVDENTVWTSCHGVRTKLKDMDDIYLANMVDYLTKRHFPNDYLVLKVIKKIIKKRGLKKEFCDRAQIPYKNPNGLWEIWNFEKTCPMILERKGRKK